jgi:hypothetical protein
MRRDGAVRALSGGEGFGLDIIVQAKGGHELNKRRKRSHVEEEEDDGVRRNQVRRVGEAIEPGKKEREREREKARALGERER